MTCNLAAGPSLVDAHFAGAISPTRERELRAHLPQCESCREYYERHMLLAAIDPKARKAQDRLAFGLGIQPPRERSLRAAPLAMALCAAAALVLAVVPLRKNLADDFSARGTAVGTDPTLLAYRIEPGRAPVTLGKTMRSADELAFAYVNPGTYRKLMIFAVDEHRHVYWYHPEWLNPADDPRAISIASDTAVHEIPSAVGHAFDGTDLTLFAVFSNEDLSVRKVEQLLQQARSLDDPLHLERAVVKKLHVTVER
jgi:hypothetical protein